MVRSIARLQADHHRESSAVQHGVSATVGLVGRSGFNGVLVLLVFPWIAGSLLAAAMGRQPVDRPPFAWLESTVSLAALFMTFLILTTRRHGDRLAQLRERMILELSIPSEQNTAKIIALLETLGRDLPERAQPYGQGGGDVDAGRSAGGAGCDQAQPRRAGRGRGRGGDRGLRPLIPAEGGRPADSRFPGEESPEAPLERVHNRAPGLPG